MLIVAGCNFGLSDSEEGANSETTTNETEEMTSEDQAEASEDTYERTEETAESETAKDESAGEGVININTDEVKEQL